MRPSRLDILHLTVLNPAQHTRIFYKLARSQARLGAKVAVAGQDAAQAPYEEGGVQILPIRPFRRLSWQRLWIQWQAFRLIQQHSPRTIVIHSPELLPLALLCRWKRRVEIWYDVHEDYAMNILHGSHYPGWLRHWLARQVRRLEKRAVQSLRVVTYAEFIYDDMLGAGQKAVVLPNTFSQESLSAADEVTLPLEEPFFLLCGTLAREWGLFEAIDLWEHLYELQPFPLVIAGHSRQAELLVVLHQRLAASRYRDAILLIGGEEPVPYATIVALIRACFAGFGLYAAAPAILGKIPTKFYEFLALGRPLVYPAEGSWGAFGREHHLGPAWEAGKSPEALLAELSAWEPRSPEERMAYCWQDEAVWRVMRLAGPEAV